MTEPLNQLTCKTVGSGEVFPVGKVAAFVSFDSPLGKSREGTDEDASFSQSQYSPRSYPHPMGTLLLALSHLASLNLPR